MFISRNKVDLMIEVWEKLDCESVGAREIIAIEEAVIVRFGRSALDSPMKIARILADEGAELRHSEIMELYVKRASERPYDAPLRNIDDFSNARTALSSIRRMENLRRKFLADGDKEGLRLLRETALNAKERLLTEGGTSKSSATEGRREKGSEHAVDDAAAGAEAKKEFAEWLTIWLGSPEVFEHWIKLRLASADFVKRFGKPFE